MCGLGRWLKEPGFGGGVTTKAKSCVDGDVIDLGTLASAGCVLLLSSGVFSSVGSGACREAGAGSGLQKL